MRAALLIHLEFTWRPEVTSVFSNDRLLPKELSHLTIIIRPDIDFMMSRTLSQGCKQSGRWFEQMSSTMIQQQGNIPYLPKYTFAQFLSWHHSVWWKINLLGQQAALKEPRRLRLFCTAELEHDPELGWKGTGGRRWTPPPGLVEKGLKERMGCPLTAGGKKDKHLLDTITYGGEICLAKRICSKIPISSLSIWRMLLKVWINEVSLHVTDFSLKCRVKT